MVQIKLPDGSVKEYPEGVSPREVAEGIGKRLAEAAVAAVADGTVVDLDRPLGGRQGRPDRAADPDPQGPRGARRPAALDGATSWPGPSCGSSRASGSPSARRPPTATTTTSTSPAEPSPRTISRPSRPRWPGSSRTPSRSSGSPCPSPRPASSSTTSARRYKVEHIDDELHKYGVLSFYRQGEFVDLCRGPHIPHAGKVGAFKLLSIAGAYWKGHTDRKMLQRVYGTAFFDKKDLDAHLAQVEEAKKRDHRRLGKELGLFTISPLVGSGLILWMPKGAIIRGILENFIKDELVRRGYQPVYTPHIGKIELYQTSGHYPYYKDSQFPTLQMLADAAAKELRRRARSRARSTTTPSSVLLAKAGIPERMPVAVAARSRPRRLAFVLDARPRPGGSATSSRRATARNTCSSR